MYIGVGRIGAYCHGAVGVSIVGAPASSGGGSGRACTACCWRSILLTLFVTVVVKVLIANVVVFESGSDDVFVVAFFFVHNSHRHMSFSSYFCFVGLYTAMKSEKKRSPLSSGNISASGKGAAAPTRSDSALTKASSA